MQRQQLLVKTVNGRTGVTAPIVFDGRAAVVFQDGRLPAFIFLPIDDLDDASLRQFIQMVKGTR